MRALRGILMPTKVDEYHSYQDETLLVRLSNPFLGFSVLKLSVKNYLSKYL